LATLGVKMSPDDRDEWILASRASSRAKILFLALSVVLQVVLASHVWTVTYRTSDLAAPDQHVCECSREAFMHPIIHNTQVVTPFGSGDAHEDHGGGSLQKQPQTRSRTILAVVLTVALFGGATAAAITATNHDRATGSLQQNLPSILGKLPGSVGFEEALY
jgi:hypothetical protein